MELTSAVYISVSIGTTDDTEIQLMTALANVMKHFENDCTPLSDDIKVRVAEWLVNRYKNS